jgi:hypothetical protein
MSQFEPSQVHARLCCLGNSSGDETRNLMNESLHLYEVRPRKDKRGVDLISDALPFGGLWYAGPNAASNAIGYAMHRSRSHDAVIRVYDDAGNVIKTHALPGLAFVIDSTATIYLD